MKILVTGGTGFIGRALTARLIEAYGADSLICLVKPPDKAAETAALSEIRAAGIRVIEGDLCRPGVSEETLPGLDLVFHLAANIDTDAPESEVAVNDRGTAHLLEWAGPSLAGARILYTSSVAVSDRGGPATGPLNEESPCFPRTAYGVTKLRGEDILKGRAPAGGYTYTIARLPTVYGPGQKPGGMFDLLATYAAHRSMLGRLNWPGKTSVMFLDDAIATIQDLAANPAAANQVYCISSGETITIAELAAEIGRATGHPVAPVALPRWAWKALRRLVWLPPVRGAVPRSAAVAFWRFTLIVDDGFWFDDAKFRSVNKTPMVMLAEGLRRTFPAGRR